MVRLQRLSLQPFLCLFTLEFIVEGKDVGGYTINGVLTNTGECVYGIHIMRWDNRYPEWYTVEMK